jgi:hypothetical protein
MNYREPYTRCGKTWGICWNLPVPKPHGCHRKEGHAGPCPCFRFVRSGFTGADAMPYLADGIPMAAAVSLADREPIRVRNGVEVPWSE